MQGKVSPEVDAIRPVYAGIDVCKERLDVYLHPLGQTVRVSNDGCGLRRLKKVLSVLGDVHVIMEATGKFHRAAQRSLQASGLRVSVVDPLRARLFARASGRLAKTDALDAHALALMGQALRPGVTPASPQAFEDLQELVNGRSATVAERTALSNRHQAATSAFLRRQLARRLVEIDRHIARLDVEIDHCIRADPGLARRAEIVSSIPGIGPVVAAALIAGLAELGTCSNKQIAMLTGLAPLANETGQYIGERHIKGGRRAPRNALYMAALSARRHNPDLAAFAKRLRGNGKKPKVVLVAVMRKLAALANTLITNDRLWTPNCP